MTPAENLFPKKQLQLAQLELVFRGPLVKDSIVQNLIDLTNLNLLYNYEHKMIWVKSEQANYYLFDGDGSEIIHWKKLVGRVVIEQYQSNQTWSQGDTVYLGGKIYKALQNVPLLYNPIDYPLYWLTISGESITYRYIFNNLSSVIIYSDIKNPVFTIIIGNFVLDVDLNYVLDTDGLILIENPEVIDAYIKRRDDLPNNNGMAYEIKFEENSLPVLLTGAINIK
jgi:hypothetical protein